MNLNEIRLTALKETLRIGKISDQEYFSKKYSAYVSNSRLGYINPEQNGSPEKFFTPMGSIYSDSLIIGSAVHQQYLQPNYFELVKIIRPTAKLGFVCDYIWDYSKTHEFSLEALKAAQESVDYYKTKDTNKLAESVKPVYEEYAESKKQYKKKPGIEPMFLGEKMFDLANKCLDACNANEKFTKTMYPDYIDQAPISENEQAFLMDIQCDFPDKDPITVRLKAKLDNYVIDFDSNTIIVNDLKTLGAILPKFDGKEGNFGKYHYHRELAIYLWLLKLYVEQKYGMKNPHMRVNCLVVSTVPDHFTKVYNVTNKEIDEGFKEFRYLLKLVAYYIAYQGYGLN